MLSEDLHCRSTCSNSPQLLGMVELVLLVLQVVWSLPHSGPPAGGGGGGEEGEGGACQSGCGQASGARRTI